MKTLNKIEIEANFLNPIKGIHKHPWLKSYSVVTD